MRMLRDRLLLAVAIDQGLQRQCTLALAGRGDDSFLDAQRSSWKGRWETCPEDNCSFEASAP